MNLRCPTCGQSCTIHSTDEGTHSFAPDPALAELLAAAARLHELTARRLAAHQTMQAHCAPIWERGELIDDEGLALVRTRNSIWQEEERAKEALLRLAAGESSQEDP